MNDASWLILMHQVPPNPPYLRAKVLRRLSHLGALPLKRSAYLLPAGEAALEDFQWLQKEIVKDGGDAWILESRFMAGLRDDEVRENFRSMRTPDYRELADAARALLERMRRPGTEQPNLDVERRRLVRRIESTRRIDFFHADGREEVEALMKAIDQVENADRGSARPLRAPLAARTWVTRAGAKVDRMASAWLIRRFIDPAATFVFVRADGSPPPEGALRFDMFDGEFTHDGDRCTFEVLLDLSSHAEDRGLRAIAEIVHELDLHDDRFHRPESAGVAALLEGITSRFDDDHRRLAESAPIFEMLYASLGGKREPPAPSRPAPADDPV
jgi:hypothetical protein